MQTIELPTMSPAQVMERRIAELEKMACDVYKQIVGHDVNRAKITLLQSGALP